MTRATVRRTHAPMRALGRLAAVLSGVLMPPLAVLALSAAPAQAEVDAVARGLAAKGAFSVPAAAYAFTFPAGSGNYTATVGNGVYQVAIDGVFRSRLSIVVDGTVVIRPNAGSTTWKEARFYASTPVPDTSTGLGTALTYFGVMGSGGPVEWGGHAYPVTALTADSSTALPVQSTGSYGCIDTTDGTDWIVADHTQIFRIKRSDSSVLASNTTPLSGLAGTPTHLGGCSVFTSGGVKYVAIEAENYFVAGSNSQWLIILKASDLTIQSTLSIATVMGKASGAAVAVDPRSNIAYIAGYNPYDQPFIQRIDATTGVALRPLYIGKVWGYAQGLKIDLTNNQLWMTVSRNYNATGAPNFAVVDLDGNAVKEFNLPSPGGEYEDLFFDADGSVNLMHADYPTSGVTTLYKFTVPATPTNTASGVTLDGTWGYRVGNTKVGTDYTVAVRSLAGSGLSGTPALWDQSSSANDGEGWVNVSGGTANSRNKSADTRTTANLSLGTAGTLIELAFSANTTTGVEALYVNGQDRVNATAGAPSVIVTGDICFWGCNPGNATKWKGTGRRGALFNRTLTETEKRLFEQDPSYFLTAGAPLTTDQKRLISSQMLH